MSGLWWRSSSLASLPLARSCARSRPGQGSAIARTFGSSMARGKTLGRVGFSRTKRRPTPGRRSVPLRRSRAPSRRRFDTRARRAPSAGVARSALSNVVECREAAAHADEAATVRRRLKVLAERDVRHEPPRLLLDLAAARLLGRGVGGGKPLLP